MKDFAERFYHSGAWLRARQAYISQRIAADGGFCEVCHERLIFIVHHKTALTPANINDPAITLSFDNLQGVCRECHELFEGHGVNPKARPLVVFDGDGEPVGALSFEP